MGLGCVTLGLFSSCASNLASKSGTQGQNGLPLPASEHVVAKAKNFSMEQMKEGIDYAHSKGVSVYVTANIIPHNEDIEQAKAMLFDRLDSMTLEERTFNFGDDFIREMYDQAEQSALLKIKKYDQEHAQ